MAMAPKSNAQIQQEYQALPFLNQLATAGNDLVRIGASGVTGGLVDRLQGQDQVEATREARVRAGLAGDVVNVGGMALGAKGALTAAKGAISAARALPTAISLVPTAGPVTAARYLTGTAGPGLVPMAAPLTRGAVAKGAALLGALGLSVAGRQDNTVTPPEPVAAAPKPSASKAAIATAQPTVQDQARAAVSAVLSQPFTLRGLQAATGALPNIAGSEFKQTSKDRGIATANAVVDTLYQNELTAAMQNPAGAARDKAVALATQNYLNNLRQNSGADPMKQLTASLIAAQQTE